MAEENFLNKSGLNVEPNEVEVGNTYPIYGMITNFLSETPGNVVVEINNSIIANLNLPTSEKIELVKQRTFETGIFVSTIISKDEKTFVDCHTVIFGKKKEFDA